MRLVQLTDCHLSADPAALYRQGYATPQLERVIDAAMARRPDMVIVTGDISNDDSPASYHQAVARLDRFQCPWFWLPGNHDNVQIMNDIRPMIPALDLGERRLLMLNTQLPGDVAGRVGETQLDELERELQSSDQPTFIAMHHPPVPVGSSWMDALSLEDEAALWHILSMHPHVEMILCGHVHHAFSTWCQNIRVCATPATSDQFLPGSDTFQLDSASRPGFRVVDARGDNVTTWVERVDP
ncbi:metallophosphoesterase family protein [Larsenimonas rhizosphaerae]|uniref:Metallophosphoesterase n=1 Tax=Larsenimonas rhizosphaerae TaxID=2944682 RepID=A0AA42CV69_9GAMM|nr:metallophosphoesterase [Larsenimonas rhizosphaerae]MCX2524721.1 metallophosphoesterase [Larsenimonas rhizosphaerae]